MSYLIALFDYGLSAASKAELVRDVAGALDKVSVLQLAIAVGALEHLAPSWA